MRRILDILTSRRTSIALMAFVAASGALGAWIPQSSLGQTEALAIWQEKNPLVARVADTLGWYDIFSSWWFFAVLGVFALALSVATVRMIAAAWRRQRGAVGVTHTDMPGADPRAIAERARAAGFRERRSAGTSRVFIRHGIGMWAPAVFHVGLLVSLASAVVALGFTSGAVADFSQGEVREPGAAYHAVEDAEDPPEIGVPIRFDGIETETWPQGGLKEVVATLSVLDEGGVWVPRTVSVNHPLRLNGHTIYAQPGEFGDAAFAIFTTPDGTEYPIRIEFVFAEEGEYVYTDPPLMIGGIAIDGRWDPHGVRDPKPLALRPAGDSSAEPVTLAEGETVTVAGLTVEYVATRKWARFIVQREPGIAVLMIGFTVIAIASLMLYAWIPRTLVLEEIEVGIRYGWRAARMSRSYLGERDAILGVDRMPGEDA